MGARSFLGVKRLVCGVDHISPSSAVVKEIVELYMGIRGLLQGERYFLPFLQIVAFIAVHLVQSTWEFIMQDMSFTLRKHYELTVIRRISKYFHIASLSDSFVYALLTHNTRISRSSYNFYSPYIQENAGAFTHTYEVPVEVVLGSVELDVNVLEIC
jgi:flagellar assembly factor FliW